MRGLDLSDEYEMDGVDEKFLSATGLSLFDLPNLLIKYKDIGNEIDRLYGNVDTRCFDYVHDAIVQNGILDLDFLDSCAHNMFILSTEENLNDFEKEETAKLSKDFEKLSEIVLDRSKNLEKENGLNEMKMNESKSDVFYEALEGAASSLWASAWADHAEQHGCSSLSGVEITDVMPSIPEQAYEAAKRCLESIERANGKPIDELYQMAIEADEEEGVHPNSHEGPESFGSDLAMQWMGHGVSWFDDHAEFPLEIPHGDPSELYFVADETCDFKDEEDDDLDEETKDFLKGLDEASELTNDDEILDRGTMSGDEARIERVLGDKRYTERSKFPKWNIMPTVLQEPRLFLKIFPELKKSDHVRLAADFLDKADTAELKYQAALNKASKQYGTDGPLISGGFREDWPSAVKDQIRVLVRTYQALKDAANAHAKAAKLRNMNEDSEKGWDGLDKDQATSIAKGKSEKDKSKKFAVNHESDGSYSVGEYDKKKSITVFQNGKEMVEESSNVEDDEFEYAMNELDNFFKNNDNAKKIIEKIYFDYKFDKLAKQAKHGFYKKTPANIALTKALKNINIPNFNEKNALEQMLKTAKEHKTMLDTNVLKDYCDSALYNISEWPGYYDAFNDSKNYLKEKLNELDPTGNLGKMSTSIWSKLFYSYLD